MTAQSNTLNKPYIGNHTLNIWIGVIGMLITCVGNITTQLLAQKLCFFVGAILLLISSLLEQQLFFILLEVIIVAGTAIAFTSLSFWAKASVPIVLSAITIFYFISQGLVKDNATLLGCVGIAFLAAGYAVTHPVIYLVGSLVLTVYSFISYYRGVTIGLLWGILNIVFAITSGIAIYHMIIS